MIIETFDRADSTGHRSLHCRVTRLSRKPISEYRVSYRLVWGLVRDHGRMALLGYTRISNVQQDGELQRDAPRNVGVDEGHIY